MDYYSGLARNTKNGVYLCESAPAFFTLCVLCKVFILCALCKEYYSAIFNSLHRCSRLTTFDILISSRGISIEILFYTL